MIEAKIWTIFFLIIAFQGFFLGLMVLIKKKEPLAQRLFLSLLIGVFSLVVLYWVGFWNYFFADHIHLNFTYNPIPLLIGPFFFLYIISHFRAISYKDYLHFIPTAIIAIYFLPFYLLNTDKKAEVFALNNPETILWNWEYIDSLQAFMHELSYACYAIYIGVFIFKKLSMRDDRETSKDIAFLKILTALFGVFSLVAALNSLAIRFIYLPLYSDFTVATIISIIIYFIGYMGFNKARFIEIFDKAGMNKYLNSGIDKNDIPKLLNLLITHIQDKKPYLREDYKLIDLSSETGIPSHHISELLNIHYHKNFSEFVNEYRIKEAKKLLVSKNYYNRTISSIGFDVGFNSRTSFYRSFKKFVGSTPSVYQKMHKKSQ